MTDRSLHGFPHQSRLSLSFPLLVLHTPLPTRRPPPRDRRPAPRRVGDKGGERKGATTHAFNGVIIVVASRLLPYPMFCRGSSPNHPTFPTSPLAVVCSVQWCVRNCATLFGASSRTPTRGRHIKKGISEHRYSNDTHDPSPDPLILFHEIQCSKRRQGVIIRLFLPSGKKTNRMETAKAEL